MITFLGAMLGHYSKCLFPGMLAKKGIRKLYFFSGQKRVERFAF